ncbi:MAG: hypothetical protein ISS15_21170 [Alphaproteobacteria bacterium]|nr:hypothetical protein [Reyranella sp.]MBL6940091.1 hypothetical protein [Alphaproteobacteria bacterium]MBL7100178.1 hypothetical protein [Alphaproteobacteria bacterium]
MGGVYDDSDEARKRRRQNDLSLDSETAQQEGTAHDLDAEAELNARKVGGLLANGRITRHQAVYLIRQFDNEQLVALNTQEQPSAAEKKQTAEHFATQSLGRELESSSVREANSVPETARFLSDRQIMELADDNTKKLIAQSKTLAAHQPRLEALNQNPAQDAVDAAKSRGERTIADSHITEAGDRYEAAHEQCFKEKDPQRTIGRAATQEYIGFAEDIKDLNNRIGTEQDVVKRLALEDEKQIVAAEYLALTNSRIAHNAEVIWGSEFAAEAEAYRERAAVFSDRAEQLRENYKQTYGRDGSVTRGHAADDQGAAEEARRGYDLQVQTGQTISEDSASSTERDSGTSATAELPERTDRTAEREEKAGSREEIAMASAPKPRNLSRSQGVSY